MAMDSEKLLFTTNYSKISLSDNETVSGASAIVKSTDAIKQRGWLEWMIGSIGIWS